MSIEVKRLREERGELIDKFQEMVRAAEREGRDLTDAERSKADDIQEKCAALRKQADELAAEEKERMERYMQRLEGRHTGGDILKRGESFRDYVRSEYGIKPPQKREGLGDLIQKSLESGKNEVRITTSGAGVGLSDAYLFADFVDMFREASVCFNAGVGYRPLTGEYTSYRFPKLTGDISCAWRSEGGTITQSTATIAALVMTPKSLSAMVVVSREAFQDLPGLNEVLMRSFAGRFAVAADESMIGLTTAANSPTGILLSTGSQNTSVSGRLTDDVVEAAVERLMTNNVPSNDLAMVCSPRDYRIYGTQIDGEAQPLMRSQFLKETNLRTYGTSSITASTANETQAVLGYFQDALWGAREELSVKLLTERYADTGSLGLIAHLRGDFLIRRPASFERLSALTTAAST